MQDRWRQIEELYHSAMERDSDERSAFLAEACAGDGALRREVESLLAYQKQAELMLEAPALEMAARRLVNLVNIEGATDNATVVVVRCT